MTGVAVDVYVWPQIVLAPGATVTFLHWIVDANGISLVDPDRWYWMSAVPQFVDVRPDRRLSTQIVGGSSPMSAKSTRYYIVHSPEGSILAAAPVEAPSAHRGVQLRWRPVAHPRHVISEVDVSEDHVALLSTPALLDLEVHVSAGAPALRRRSKH